MVCKVWGILGRPLAIKRVTLSVPVLFVMSDPAFCREFSLDNFDDYAKHFTVMNYRENDELKQVGCPASRLFE